MDRKALYENLARHLNQGIVGAPMSPSLMGILEIMFSEEEAEVAGRLPFENKTLEELKELFPDKAGVNPDLCIGCGVCTPTCPTGAVSLELRGTVTPPPGIAEFFTKRYLPPEP